MNDYWAGKGVDQVVAAGDTVRNTHSGETFRVLRVNRHDAVAISNQYGNQVAIPRHQFVEGDFQVSCHQAEEERRFAAERRADLIEVRIGSELRYVPREMAETLELLLRDHDELGICKAFTGGVVF
ncbi:hypothetical protein I3U44_17015 [Mycobacteroides abscessus subsp. bolletii]|uniref:hypothetical protein n=1 Tax=Mycobacteroides abscessus TaxID=36809 RepID=UPI0019CF8062|nr:hypothetical protein [Mycobacteroides abscessus]QSM87530.1 hypothetical protein I3U44_17015 [Mycobacteroides abscessus subsp. bolletii]